MSWNAPMYILIPGFSCFRILVFSSGLLSTFIGELKQTFLKTYSSEQLWQTENIKSLTVLDLFSNDISDEANYETFEAEHNKLQYLIFLYFWFLQIPESTKAISSIWLVWAEF
jgi:hypothetical protein